MSSDLLFYEDFNGLSQYYMTSNGDLGQNRSALLPQTGWTHIVQGQFDGGGLCNLIFYNAVTGTLQLWVVYTTPDGLGQTKFLKEVTGWRSGWTFL